MISTVFGNIRDIDFASTCMVVLAINTQISDNLNSTFNFMKFNRTIFNVLKQQQATS